MKDWSRLTRTDPPYFHLLRYPHQTTDELISMKVSQMEIRPLVRFIRAWTCVNVTDSFNYWAAAFQFPWYFGYNINAFDECIKDLSWLKSNAYLTIITQCHKLLVLDSDINYALFFSVLKSAAEYWAEPDPAEWASEEHRAYWARPPVPFHIILQYEEEFESDVTSRLSLAGVSADILN